MAQENDRERDITEERGFKTTLGYYRIYRHFSAILLIIAQMHTGKRYGSGWKWFYEYEQNGSINK